LSILNKGTAYLLAYLIFPFQTKFNQLQSIIYDKDGLCLHITQHRTKIDDICYFLARDMLSPVRPSVCHMVHQSQRSVEVRIMQFQPYS